MMWDQGHRARMATSRLRTDLDLSNQEYRAVVDAIRRGSAPEAVAHHRQHRERTSVTIIGLLEQYRLGSV